MKNSFFRRAAAIALCSAVGASALTGCGSTKIDGTKTVMTVGDEDVSLGVVSYYAKYQQAMMYSYYGSYFSNGFFDTSIAATSSNDGETYGEQIRNTCLDDIKKMVVISQHAADYDVALTDEEEQTIADIAQNYIDSNSEEVREKVGASYDDVVRLLELQTIQSKMMDPLVENVDTNVTQEEAQQSKVTYIAVSTDDTASEADSEAESTTADAEADGPSADAQAKAEQVLAALQSEDDIANADMNTIAQGIDADLSAVEGHYTTSNTTDGSVDSAVVEAVEGLEDGTLVDHVITGSDGTTLYIARFDLLDDETYTETTKESIIRSRKQDEYDSVTDGWMEETEIKVNQSVLKTLQLSDSDPVTLAASTAESTEETAEADSVQEASSTAS